MRANKLERESPRYDAFVVRLWRDSPTECCLRAEVEHVRTGVLARATVVPIALVLTQILANLGVTPGVDVSNEATARSGNTLAD